MDNLYSYFLKLHKSLKSDTLIRVCHIQHNQLDTQICDIHGRSHTFWTVDEYDEIIRVARLESEEESDEDVNIEIDQENLFTDCESDYDESDESENDEDAAAVIETRGLKIECPLNVLESFHCIQGFPFDIMHDVFEGRTSLINYSYYFDSVDTKVFILDKT